MADKRYNGWTNYETWCVNLWLDNEPGTQKDKQDIIRQAESKYDAYFSLKSYVEDLMPDLGATMASDLLSAALSEVDWDEIVDAEWDELHEDEDKDDEGNDND